MTSPALSISLPPIPWPSQSLGFSPIYLSLSLPIPLPLHLFYSPWSCSQSLQLTPPLSPPPHGQTQWPRLPASFDVSDVTPTLQMPLHRQSYPLREPAQPTERGPVINPAQPGPLLHCLNTWCITTPIPMHPHPTRLTQTCMCGRGPMMQ